MDDLIKANTQYYYGHKLGMDFDAHLDHNNEEEIRDLLLGRKVQKVADDHILLDNNILIKLFGNDGGCACDAGCYNLTDLNEVDNIITNVEFVRRIADDDTGSKWGEPDEVYEIFVVAEDKKIRLAAFEGTDGNGYYGTGYHLLIRVGEE